MVFPSSRNCHETGNVPFGSWKTFLAETCWSRRNLARRLVSLGGRTNELPFASPTPLSSSPSSPYHPMLRRTVRRLLELVATDNFPIFNARRRFFGRKHVRAESIKGALCNQAPSISQKRQSCGYVGNVGATSAPLWTSPLPMKLCLGYDFCIGRAPALDCVDVTLRLR